MHYLETKVNYCVVKEGVDEEEAEEERSNYINVRIVSAYFVCATITSAIV